MVFSSTTFLFIFLPIVLIGYFNPFYRGIKFRNVFLLIMSLLFYAWGEPFFVLVMIASIIVNWSMGLVINKKKKKFLLVITVIYNVGLLFIFKYLTFISINLGYLLKNDTLTIKIALPIGISFFTFQMLSYIWDVYYGIGKVQKNILKLALYISMFPQLIAGPIVRYNTVADEINNRTVSSSDLTQGMTRFVYGLGKKVILSNYLGLIADNIFSLTDGNISIATAWLGAIVYSLQIFFDFSGYSDMAIGLGRVLGFHFLENFNYPFIAKSITDFWTRWHISLTSWFRDYVFTPIAMGSKLKGKHKLIFVMFIVWLLTGIWHGANWTFIIWGLFFFVFLAIEKVTRFTKKLKGFSRIYAILVIIISFVIFRSESISLAIKYLGKMFGVGSSGIIDHTFILYITSGKWIILAGILLSMPVVPKLKDIFKSHEILVDIIRSIAVLIIFVVSILLCIKSTYNPFIYFNF